MILGLVTDSQRGTWTAFAILAMFYYSCWKVAVGKEKESLAFMRAVDKDWKEKHTTCDWK